MQCYVMQRRWRVQEARPPLLYLFYSATPEQLHHEAISMTPLVGANSVIATEDDSSLIESVRLWILEHPHFHGRAECFSIELEEGAIVVRGQLPSFALQRLLGAWLARFKAPVSCCVEVVNPQGISGCSPRTRELCALQFSWLGKVPRCVPTCDASPGRLSFEGRGGARR
jgi:hypothetical protein